MAKRTANESTIPDDAEINPFEWTDGDLVVVSPRDEVAIRANPSSRFELLPGDVEIERTNDA